MQPEEFKAIDQKFRQGLGKLEQLRTCMQQFAENQGVHLPLEDLDTTAGELAFWYAGTRYYVRVRISDRDVDDLEPGYRVPIGWLDWGRYAPSGARDQAEQSNYYDERGVLCDKEKEEFYCTLDDCSDSMVRDVLSSKLQRLVTRTIAINNVEA
jgi:hypothetical protein